MIRQLLGPFLEYHKGYSTLRLQDSYRIRQERLIYACPLNKKKRKNLARIPLSNRYLRYFDLTLPHILHVGVTTHCNLRCTACPTGTGSLGRKKEYLDFNLYCRTVDSMRDSLLFMLFWDWGEPLLHPKLPEMIEYARLSGIRSVISTNGNVKRSEEKMTALVKAQPDTIIVCVDGADQKTYQTYRRGGKLNKVLGTIRQLVAAKQKLGLSLPVVEFRSLATQGTEKQMPDLLRLAQSSGADLFSVKTLRPFDYRGTNVDDLLVPGNKALARYHYDGDEPTVSRRIDYDFPNKIDCGKPLHAPTLNADGTLAFCSYAQFNDEFFGPVPDNSFKKLWNSAKSRQHRLSFLRNGGTKSCTNCYFRSEPKPTIIHQVPLKSLPETIQLEQPETIEDFLSYYQ